VMPIRYGGWFLPQLLVSGYLQRQERKIPFYRRIVVLRSIMLLNLTLVVAVVPRQSGWLPGLFFLALIAYSLSSGLGGIPFMDSVGKVIPAERRGAFFSQRMFWGGMLALGTSSLVGFLLEEPAGLPFPTNFAVIFGLAFIWLSIAMGSWCFIKEPPEQVDQTHIPWTEQLRRGIGLLKDNARYRTFVAARLCTILAQIAASFYIVYAKTVLGVPAAMVGVYLTVRTASSILSNLVWGRLGDRKGNRLLIRLTNAIGALMPVCALGIGALYKAVPDSRLWLAWGFAAVFGAAGAFSSGSSIGNINYLFDIAPPKQRALYLGFTNTIFGIGIFSSVLGGLIVDWAGFTVLLSLSAVFYGVAFLLSMTMAEPRTQTS